VSQCQWVAALSATVACHQGVHCRVWWDGVIGVCWGQWCWEDCDCDCHCWQCWNYHLCCLREADGCKNRGAGCTEPVYQVMSELLASAMWIARCGYG